MDAIAVFCSTAQCGEFLGDLRPSIVDMRPGLVWTIQPGWQWSDLHLGRGILERTDQMFTAERRLLHEVTGRARRIDGVALSRTVRPPFCIRCPKCRKVRWVAPPTPVPSARS